MLGKLNLNLSGIDFVNSYSGMPIGLLIPLSAYSASNLLRDLQKELSKCVQPMHIQFRVLVPRHASPRSQSCKVVLANRELIL